MVWAVKTWRPTFCIIYSREDNKKVKKKDRVEILFEKIQGDVALILGGHSVLNNKIDGLSVRIDRLELRIDRLEFRVRDLEFQVKTINTSLNLLSSEIKELNVKFDRHISQPVHMAHIG